MKILHSLHLALKATPREFAATQTNEEPPAVVGACNIIEGQCWAMRSGDGTHYTPLVSVEFQTLSYHMKDFILIVVSPTIFSDIK